MADGTEAQERLKKLCELWEKVADIAGNPTVDFFSKNLWETVPEIWREELLSMDDEELRLLHGLKLRSKERGGSDGSSVGEQPFHDFVRTASELCVDRAYDWHMEVENIHEPSERVCVGSQDMRDVVFVDKKWHKGMNEKKREEIRGMRDIVVVLANAHGISLAVDVGAGKGYLSHCLGVSGLR
ncbi:hypothetical protein GUITHDRAFT_139215 [Guillardia theta CCMP2712]|uniref:Methyltransferase domain-containing protein n=1 Tax=Guillardia theta (strain CCMP2712) TaxID=905079 RepID=L1JAK2_GUITC|nr:hypothetical protein GUITHDRAFT_139215 [Guillardia theta CCMP2712]EKX45322.1 hypothetical protein GUITHDRAFT_139215 [Guillardia theta CCMP2712]|eukprot:XP_005832302.1 hypothetical protein GUITHDRAFT_139215 [Guillardia theta CCMP2712]